MIQTGESTMNPSSTPSYWHLIRGTDWWSRDVETGTVSYSYHRDYWLCLLAGRASYDSTQSNLVTVTKSRHLMRPLRRYSYPFCRISFPRRHPCDLHRRWTPSNASWHCSWKGFTCGMAQKVSLLRSVTARPSASACSFTSLLWFFISSFV